MLVPKYDILKVEKKTLALIFSNALTIYTSKGEITFSSFVNRSTAYK